MIKTYTEFLALQSGVNGTSQILKRLGIDVDTDCGVVYNWQKIEYINRAVSQDSWGCGLLLQDALALTLACTEEDRNNHIEDSEIEEVNRFFGVKVTRDLVTQLHSKYI